MDRIIIDQDSIQTSTGDILPLYSYEAFNLISDLWLKIGFSQKQTYKFTWLGRPIIQLPDDMIKVQEVIYKLKPDVIIETGVANGGSLIYYASLCKLIGKGRVIGVDIEIRPHNREAIESHELASMITLIEGDSISNSTLQQVKSLVNPEDKVLVILDSCHTKDHVYQELLRYSPLVTAGSYIVACDGIMQDLFDNPLGDQSWENDNPVEAVKIFLETSSSFKLDPPSAIFNESTLDRDIITHWPSAWLKKI